MLGVAQSQLVDSYGIILLCVQLGGTILITWNLVQAVLYHSIRGVVVVIGCLSFLSKFHTSCSQLHEESTGLLFTWAKSSSAPYFVKFRKASKSIRVPIGKFFYFDRSLVLTTMSVILDNFVNLVVAFGSAH